MKTKQTHARSTPALTQLKSETGSFAVVMALCLMLMISALAFALDIGYFAKEKSSYQACAEAAAMSAAENFCYGRAVEAAETVAYASNVLLPEDSVTVQFGFYDAYGEHLKFSTYRDFAAEPDEDDASDSDYPADETNNAVMVTIENTVQSLTGFNKEKKIMARAVAYVPRVSIVSGRYLSITSSNLEPVKVNNGNIYAKKKILLYGPGVGENVKAASGKIYLFQESGTTFSKIGLIPSDDLPEMDIIVNHILPLEEYVEKMKQVADITYTPDDSGKKYFYGTVHDTSGGGNTRDCYFDFSEDHDEHIVVFFDTTGFGGTINARITPHACLGFGDGWSDPTLPCMQQIGPTEAKGSSMKNVTFIANCPITIDRNHALKPQVPLGGFGDDQLNLVSTKDIGVFSGNNPLKGVNFYCQRLRFVESTLTTKYSEQDTEYYIRAITSTHNIELKKTIGSAEDDFTLNFKFGPPCPAVVPPTLGRLVLSAE